MSHYEEYIVDSTADLSPDMFQLSVHLKPGSAAPTAVTSIVLIKGADSLTNRTGLEFGTGATINLTDSDFLEAVESIEIGDVVNYLSDPIASRRPPPRASIQGFDFPMDYP